MTSAATAPRATASKNLAVQSLWGTVDVLDQIAGEWRELCQEGPCDQPFFRPEWIAASARAFGQNHRLLVVTVRDGGHLRAVLPLWEEKTRVCGVPVTRLSSVGSPDHSPRFDFVHGRGADIEQIANAAWTELKSLTDWDVIHCRNVPRGAAIELLLDIARKDGFLTYQHLWAESPYIDLSGLKPQAGFSQFARSRRFRHRLRHSWRKLEEMGEISLRRVETADPDTIEQFYRLEQSGWKGEKGTAITCRPETREFYDCIVKSAAGSGYLSIYFLDQGNKHLAAHLALTYSGRYFPLKVAYDESYSKYGPGHLIIAAVLQDCVARGLTEFDCLGHQTEAKSKWAVQARPHDFTYIFRNGIVGRTLYVESHLAQKVQASLRRVVSTLRGSAEKGRSDNKAAGTEQEGESL